MAGSNQAVNLGGMLTSMNESIRRGFTVGGQSAGDAFAQAYTQRNAPEVDSNNPQSMREYAAWARRQGKDDVAMQYETQAAQLERQQGAMQRMGGMMQVGSQGVAAAQQGDPNAVMAAASKIRQQAGAAQTPAEMAEYNRQAQQLQAMVPAAKQAQVAKQVDAISQIDAAVVNPQIDPRAQTALKQRRAVMMENPEVSEAYQAQQLQQAQVAAQQAAAEVATTTQALRPEFEQLYGTPAYEDWKTSQIENGNGQYVSDFESAKVRQEADQLRLDDLRAARDGAAAPMDVTLVESLVDRIDTTSIPGPQAEKIKARMLQLKGQMEDFNSKDAQVRASEAPRTMRERMAAELNQYAAIINNASYAKAAGSTGSLKALTEEREKIRTYIARSEPETASVERRALGLAATADKDIIYKESAPTWLREQAGISPELDPTIYEATYTLMRREAVSRLVAREAQLTAEIKKMSKPDGLMAWMAAAKAGLVNKAEAN